mmetsp:Transcript_9688/g.16176  ORF Transcript_9688/g.16176 Transcript_9688/m.16176 type:complete len:737 (-) Transcript_9688:169-2379(-)
MESPSKSPPEASENAGMVGGNEDSWAIATYLRVKPTFLPQDREVDFEIQDISMKDGTTRSLIELVIPSDADPGLVHNNALTGMLRYEFDKIFDPTTTQQQVFDSVAREKIQGVLDGFSCTIFAYGQTGSGKTYTIFGGETFADRGLIPRSLGLLFAELKQRKTSIPAFAFKCQISFTEIYKETVYDLLDTARAHLPREEWATVQLLEGEQGLVLKNLNVFEVENEEEALELFFTGHSTRLTTNTAMNTTSSRSHAVFTIALESEGVRAEQTVFTSGKVHLVDLAGSERMYKTTNTKGMIREAKAINLSLHFLEQVIISLRDQTLQYKKYQHQQHLLMNGKTATAAIAVTSAAVGSAVKPGSFIPYRNSALTNMLRDSLGGNCKSCFLLTINPERPFFEESVATCRFGQRCGEVKVEVTANAEVGLSDQLKELTVKVRNVERQLGSVEEEKQHLQDLLDREQQLRMRQTQTRSLTAEEQLLCKTCVQDLLAAAKESMLAQEEAAGEGLSEEDRASALARAADIIELSHDKLFDTVEEMDKSILVELSTALGGLVQSMFVDRETTKQRLVQEEVDRRDQQAQQEAREEQARRENALLLNGNFEALAGMSVLPDVLRSVVVKGAVFIKHSRLMRTEVRHVAVTADLSHLVWHLVGSGGSGNGGNVSNNSHYQNTTSHPLQFFDSACQDGGDPNRIVLKGRPGQKTVTLEYADGNSEQERRKGLQQWVAALQFILVKMRR